MKLAHKFYLMVIPAIMAVGIGGAISEYFEYKELLKSFSIQEVTLNEKELAKLGGDPLFQYYLVDRNKEYEEDIKRDKEDIAYLFTSEMETSINHNKGIRFLGFYDTRWVPIVSAELDASDGSIKTAIEAHAPFARGVDLSSEFTSFANGYNRITDHENIVAVPLTLDGVVYGFLMSIHELPIDSIRAQAKDLIFDELLTLLIQLSVIVFVVGLVTRSLTMPFRRMVSHAEKIAQEKSLSNFHTDTKVQEFKTLNAALNRMIDEIKNSQTELTEARDEAITANKSKTRFLAAASHDLRQPIQALELFTGVLESENKDENLAEIITNIQSSVEALGGLLGSLLDISKLDAGSIVAETRRFYLSEVLDHIATEFKSQCKANGLSFRYVPCHDFVETDPTLLERILRNLLQNALRYTEQGKILLGCRHHANSIDICIVDTGIGIPLDHQNLIFNEFHQVGNKARRRSEGLGLGLAIVKRLANLLKAPITLKSTPNKGSMFSITLALSLDQEAALNPVKVQTTKTAIDRKNILVIDDDPDVLRALTLAVQSWSCRAISASSAEEAVTFIRNSKITPDIIIADFRLIDGETGPDVIHAVRAVCSKPIPAILLTGDTAPDRIKEAEDSGFPLLHKPIQMAKLKAQIFSLI